MMLSSCRDLFSKRFADGRKPRHGSLAGMSICCVTVSTVWFGRWNDWALVPLRFRCIESSESPAKTQVVRGQGVVSLYRPHLAFSICSTNEFWVREVIRREAEYKSVLQGTGLSYPLGVNVIALRLPSGVELRICAVWAKPGPSMKKETTTVIIVEHEMKGPYSSEVVGR